MAGGPPHAGPARPPTLPSVAVVEGRVTVGAGIAALPDYLAAGLIIPDSNCPVQRELWMVIHDDVRKAPRVRRTADLLAELFSIPAR